MAVLKNFLKNVRKMTGDAANSVSCSMFMSFLLVSFLFLNEMVATETATLVILDILYDFYDTAISSQYTDNVETNSRNIIDH